VEDSGTTDKMMALEEEVPEEIIQKQVCSLTKRQKETQFLHVQQHLIPQATPYPRYDVRVGNLCIRSFSSSTYSNFLTYLFL
jgi:hypothetical protein